MNDTTRDELERRIADIIHSEICGYIPSTDPILYLEGNDHGNQLESVTREVIREIVAARDAEIREALLSDETVQRVEATVSYMDGYRDHDIADGVIGTALDAIGLGDSDTKEQE